MNPVPTPTADPAAGPMPGPRPERETARRRGRAGDAIVLGALAAVVGGAAGARPSLWFDEAATISAATRPLPDLWRLLTHIDAVHGLYYLLMHGWFAVFPATEFWSRAPSALAVGGAAAGVVTLTRSFCPRSTAVCAGALFAVLPRITWAGIEARPYAFAALTTVWLTVLCVAAARRNSIRAWSAYWLLTVVTVLVSVFSVLVVPAHVVVPRVLGAGRAAASRWIVAVTAALATVTPFLLVARTQIWQVGWISPLGPHTFVEVVQQQYFDKSVPFALLAGAVLIVGIGLHLTRARRAQPDGPTRLLVICAAWIVVPTVATLGYSAFAKSVYYPRYLIGTAPAMAVILAICLTTLTGITGITAAATKVTAGSASSTATAATVVSLVVFTAAAAPNYLVTQRDRHAKEGWDYSQVADVVAANAGDGDCLVVDNTTGWKPGPIRALLAGRPGAFAGLTDPGRGPRGPVMGRLWDGHIAVWAITDQLDRCETIWAITDHDVELPDRQSGETLPFGRVFARSPAGQVLRRLSFHPVQRWQFTFSQVVETRR